MSVILCRRAMCEGGCCLPERPPFRIPAPKNVACLPVRLAIGLVLVLVAALPALGQVCSQPRNEQFYQDNGYTIRKIEFRSPFNFIFLVRHQLQKVKESLSIVEGQPFSKKKYDESFDTVEKTIRSDDSFGDPMSHTKLIAKTASIENCQEGEGAPKTLDVVYRIFSTDPILSIGSLPEKRQGSVEEPATTAAEESTKPFYKLRPLFGYEAARRGYGGIDLLLRIPGQIFDDIHLSASGSSTSRVLEFQLNGSKVTNRRLLERVDYHLAYNYSRLPVSDLRLDQGSFQARFTGFSKPRETPSSRTVMRFGASIEAGNQQSSPSSAPPPPGTVANSAYGAVRAFVGLTRTTRYSEAAISYGLQIGGTGLVDLSFAKQVGDVTYSRRFQGKGDNRHAPWDIQARFSVGRITGSKGILINDRFFGGNSVVSFIPGDSWSIPGGPIVRSIPTNRLNAGGFGGTSFYSTNVTIGKVIVFKPLIPQEVEEADGFNDAVNGAENGGETFFADDYLSATPEYKALTVQEAAKLKTDVATVQATFTAIRATGTVAPGLDKVLKKAESLARGVQNIIRHTTVPDDNGKTTPQALSTLLNPNTSLLLAAGTKPGLLVLLPQLQPLVSPEVYSQLENSAGKIKQDLVSLRAKLDGIKLEPPGLRAAEQARKDMERPREVIDTLRHEVNSYSFSLVGLFDSGRLWPDPLGTRYAIGGAGRVSLVNVNFTLGYAVNPHPQPTLGQGRGAMVFSLTYTNLFR